MKRSLVVAGTVVLAAMLGTVIVNSCSSSPETEAERQARWTAGNLTSWEYEHGIGPVTEELPATLVDPARAASGRELFINKCATCHYLDFKKTGPPLRDVAKRRSPEYILNQILNPDQMGKLHPEGKKLVAQFMQYMTIQGITRENAEDLFNFLKSEADNPPLAMEDQPGFGTPPPPPGQ